MHCCLDLFLVPDDSRVGHELLHVFVRESCYLAYREIAKAFWKPGHFFSITFQLSPAVNSDLVIRSKYSSSFLGGLTFQLGDTDSVEAFYIFMDFEFAPLRGLQGFSTEGSLGPFEHVSHKIS